MADRKRVTSFDVAEAAGVSQSTVSRALAGSPAITEATRARVAAAASTLGYFVDERAARLRRGATGTLAVVVIGRPGAGTARTSNFTHTLLGEICAAASTRGYETLVSFQAEPNALFGHYVARGEADGLIVIGTTANAPAWDYFAQVSEDAPSAIFWGAPDDALAFVRSDNRAAGALAARRLIDGGRRRLAYVGALDTPQRQFAERWEGFAAAAKAAGVPARLVALEPGLGRDRQGRQAGAALLADRQGTDGVFGCCDAVALGLLATLREAGVAVPGDMAVIGFDGIEAGAHAAPPLTTLAPDLAIAAATLVDTVLGVGGHDGTSARVPVALVERASG